MDTPPYSDISPHLSPDGHPIHVNGDHPSSTALAHSNSHPNPSNSSDPIALDVRLLYSSSWSALDNTPPPTLREILTAYKQKGDGDRDMLLAMLNAKTAEDQRIASQLSLRRAMLEINKYSFESRSPLVSHLQYPHGQGQVYTYVPDEQYPLAESSHHHHHHHHHQQQLLQHHITPASPSAPPHPSYSSTYATSHGQAPRSNHAHLRAVDSPPLSSVTQKTALSSSARAARPVSLHSHSRSVTRSVGAGAGDSARSQMHRDAISASQSQSQAQALATQEQSQRRKRARLIRVSSRSPSRSPIGVTAASTSSAAHHRAYATYSYTRSPPRYANARAYAHPASSVRHARFEIDPELDRSPYSSASASESGASPPRGGGPTRDSGDERGHGHASPPGQTYTSGGYPRMMAIGSLLTAGAKANASAASSSQLNDSGSGSGSGPTTNGVSNRSPAGSGEHVKEEMADRDREQETGTVVRENDREVAWAQAQEEERGRKRRGGSRGAR